VIAIGYAKQQKRVPRLYPVRLIIGVAYCAAPLSAISTGWRRSMHLPRSLPSFSEWGGAGGWAGAKHPMHHDKVLDGPQQGIVIEVPCAPRERFGIEEGPSVSSAQSLKSRSLGFGIGGGRPRSPCVGTAQGWRSLRPVEVRVDADQHPAAVNGGDRETRDLADAQARSVGRRQRTRGDPRR
jgi:hypothetical protein